MRKFLNNITSSSFFYAVGVGEKIPNKQIKENYNKG